MEVGERVKQVREAAGLNQRDFAARLATGAGRISQIESGKNMPGGDLLLRLHQEFKVDLNWLLSGGTVSGEVPEPALTREEAALVDNYRNAPKEQQAILKATSAAFAQRSGRRHA